jgi:hypothetical protein
MKSKIRTSILIGIISLFATISYAQSTVVKRNGDKVTGTIESMNNGIITLTKNGATITIKVSDVSTIMFDDAGSQPTDNGQKVVSLNPNEKTIAAGSSIVRYLVNERTITKAPTISNLTRERGTVVVTLTIDRYGLVHNAEPTANGSNTTSQYIFTKAKQAAESMQFNADKTAPIEEKGYVIIPF